MRAIFLSAGLATAAAAQAPSGTPPAPGAGDAAYQRELARYTAEKKAYEEKMAAWRAQGAKHPPAAKPIAVASAAADDPNRRICRQETHIGSRMATVTCKTLAEWRAADGADASARGFAEDRRLGVGANQ